MRCEKAKSSRHFHRLLIMIAILAVSIATYVTDVNSEGEITGCANNASQKFNGVFDPDLFILNDVLPGEGNVGLGLNTSKGAIDPNSIVIDKEQEVWATYFYEGAGYKSDFGWFLYSDAVDNKGNDDPSDDEFIGWDALLTKDQNARNAGEPPVLHPIFVNINDDNKDSNWETSNNSKGVFDTSYGANGGFPVNDEAKLADITLYDDGSGLPFIVDGDGIVEPIDMRKSLGNKAPFAPGTELVFFLAADHRWNASGKSSSTFFSKSDWNPDHYVMDWKYKRVRGNNDSLFDCFDDAVDSSCISACDGADNEKDCLLACYDTTAANACLESIRDCLEDGTCHDGWTIETQRKVPEEDDLAGADGEDTGEPGWLLNSWSPEDYSYTVSGDINIDVDTGNGNSFGEVTKLTTGDRKVKFNSDNPPKFNRRFQLGVGGGESWRSDAGWLASAAVTRMNDIFGVYLDQDENEVITFENNKKYQHLIVASPEDDPDQWVLGWDDQPGTGWTDADFNDMVFRIELEAFGIAQVKSENAMVPEDTSLNYTAVTIRVKDTMPADCGVGKTNIDYYIALDGGVDDESWMKVEWQMVNEYNVNQDTIGNPVTDWEPGAPEDTFRVARIDMAEAGFTGNQLVWKAELRSKNESCIPKIIDVEIEGDVAGNGIFSRSSPIVRTNVVYSGTYETPAASWADDDKYMRGHMVATRIYDPSFPAYEDGTSATVNDAEPLWDAGARLLLQDPSARNIYYPDITYHSVPDEQLIPKRISVGQECTGTLDNTIIQAGSLVIKDDFETFTDKHTTQLVGDQGGEGWINRFTGEYYIKFGNANFTQGGDIRASYKYYVMNESLKPFTNANANATMLNLTDEHVITNDGMVYKDDLDGDDAFDPVADKNFLVQWTRGYKDGASTKKPWILGAIDHSAPALSHAPGKTFWYESLNDTERAAYDQFMADHYNEQAILLVGARDGMLHAFDAGHFRWGDNEKTADIQEYRGYFEFGETSLIDLGDKAYTYGTGDELWAFIPANLLPRLKNNFKKSGRQAYVDASPAVADVYVDGEWKSVVLSAQGNGGDTIFCLDITTPTTPKFMWEFLDPDLYRSKSSPAVGQVGKVLVGGKSNWVTFFVSGAPTQCDGDANNPYCYPSIFMLDMADGRVIKRIFLDSVTGGMGGVPSGQPAIVDYDNNGFLDSLYVGTDKGYMYKVTLPDATGGVADIDDCVINEQLEGNNSTRDPIYASPTVIVNEDASGKWVDIFFGTSDNPYLSGDSSPDTIYSFYAYQDSSGKGCSAATLSWSLEMPAGHRIFATAFAAAGKVYFGTSTQDTEDPCGMPAIEDSGPGRLYMMDQNWDSVSDPEYVEVGDIASAPVIDDEHIYFKTVDGEATGPQGDLNSIGGKEYNKKPKEMQLTGQLSPVVQGWREVTERD